MGCFERGAVKLFAEETLYLVEREALVLLPSAPVEDEEHPDPITARECYDLCLRNEDQNDGQRCPLACYWTYQQLKGLGYVVCRPQQYAAADGSRELRRAAGGAVLAAATERARARPARGRPRPARDGGPQASQRLCVRRLDGRRRETFV